MEVGTELWPQDARKQVSETPKGATGLGNGKHEGPRGTCGESEKQIKGRIVQWTGMLHPAPNTRSFIHGLLIPSTVVLEGGALGR